MSADRVGADGVGADKVGADKAGAGGEGGASASPPALLPRGERGRAGAPLPAATMTPQREEISR